MSAIKTELSKKSQYYIPKFRYLELKNFCFQYPMWEEALKSLDGLSHKPEDLALFPKNEHGDPTARCAAAREYYMNRIIMVNDAATLATDYDSYIFIPMLEAVTRGVSYDIIKLHFDISYSRNDWYEMYRKFFWILNKSRE